MIMKYDGDQIDDDDEEDCDVDVDNLKMLLTMMVNIMVKKMII
jgi:hypothetical protein